MEAQVVTTAGADTVSPADNLQKLKKIDRDITEIVKSVDRADTKNRSASAKIIAAGVRMLEIRNSDQDAWNDFKKSDPLAAKIECKGSGKEMREVATVIWRAHKDDAAMSRERVSVYGKAIHIAHNTFWATTKEKPVAECKTDEELVGKLQTLGIKGLLKIGGTNTGEAKDRRVSIKVPTRWTVYLIGPDRTQEEVPEELAKLVIKKMGKLQ